MLNNCQQLHYWDHTLANEIIQISFDQHRTFSVSIDTQVLKLASRYASQCSKNIVSCILIGSCSHKSVVNRIDIKVDRIECNLASYLSDNKLICSDDICIPLKCYKSKADLNFSEDEFMISIKEVVKNFEDASFNLSLSNSIFIRAYAGFINSNNNNSHTVSPNLNWIELKLIYLDVHLSLAPLNRLPVFRSALVNSLEGEIYSGLNENNLTFGYLTIDHLNKLHFILHSDDRVTTASLVGVWVHGEFEDSNLFSLFTCIKYILLQKSINRTCKPPFPFLLARFTNDTNEPIKYFDVKWPMGPSEDQDSVLKYVNFKLLSASDDLDAYYQSKSGKTIVNYGTKLCSVSKTDKASVALSGALKTYLSELRENFENDDIKPRDMRNQWKLINSNPSSEFQGLEVPDVSLIVKDNSSESSFSSNILTNIQERTGNHSANSDSNDYPPNLISKITISSNKESDEAIPRPLNHKPKPLSSNLVSSAKEESNKPYYQPVQFFSQQPYPFQPMMPTNVNPYFMYSPNMLITSSQMLPVITKPPQPPRNTENAIKKLNMNNVKKINDHKPKKTASNSSRVHDKHLNHNKDKSVIADVTNQTNKLSKRILQLDREEDLAMLENLIQQIINQRHPIKTQTVSTATNTSSVFSEQRSKKIVEVSTDLPSFIGLNMCSRCCREINKDFADKSIICRPNNVSDNFYEEAFSEDHCGQMTQQTSYTDDFEENSENIPDESQQFNELLTNLEGFVEEVRQNSIYNSTNEKSVHESDNYESKINVIEEAVRNLRELETDKDFESQYWETVHSSKLHLPEEDNHIVTNKSPPDVSSLDVTILQQKINYVSLFLNTSSLTLHSSDDSSSRRSSASEQSAFIEELAWKYLHKAKKDLEKIQKSSKFSIPSSSYTSRISNNLSIDTKEYFRRHNLNQNFDDNEMRNSSTAFYSSIRLPDGNSLPKNKILISSTPAPSGQPLLDQCFKKMRNQGHITEEPNWSCVRILEGINHQPIILPAINQDSTTSWSQKDVEFEHSDCSKFPYSEDIVNVLDIEKLKQLPKYL